MGKILLPGAKWNKQPQYPVKIDKKWLARGLKAFYILNANLWRINLVTGKISGSAVGTGHTFHANKIRTSGAAGQYITLGFDGFSAVAPFTVVVGYKHISGSVDWSILRAQATWTGLYADSAGVNVTNASSFDGLISPVSGGINNGVVGFLSVAMVGTNNLQGCLDGGAITTDTTVATLAGSGLSNAYLGAAVRDIVDNLAVADFTHFGIFDGALTDQELRSLSINPWQIFAPQKRNIYVSVANGEATLLPSLLTDSDTFYSATVSPGAVSLTPALFTDSDTFHSATVAPGAIALSPALFADSDTFYSPSMSVGAVTLTPVLFTDGDTFYAPSVGTGGADLTPALFTDADTFFTPTVTPGAVTLTPSLYVDADTFYAATVAAGGSLFPDVYVDADTFYPHVVAAGAVNIAPALFVDSDVFYSPIATPGSVALTPALIADVDTFYSADISQGLALLPSLFTDSDTFYAPTIGIGAVSLLPALFVDSDIFYSPAITLVGAWPGEPFNFASPITRTFGFTSSITKTLSFDSPI